MSPSSLRVPGPPRVVSGHSPAFQPRALGAVLPLAAALVAGVPGLLLGWRCHERPSPWLTRFWCKRLPVRHPDPSHHGSCAGTAGSCCCCRFPLLVGTGEAPERASAFLDMCLHQCSRSQRLYMGDTTVNRLDEFSPKMELLLSLPVICHQH